MCCWLMILSFQCASLRTRLSILTQVKRSSTELMSGLLGMNTMIMANNTLRSKNASGCTIATLWGWFWFNPTKSVAKRGFTLTYLSNNTLIFASCSSLLHLSFCPFMRNELESLLYKTIDSLADSLLPIRESLINFLSVFNPLSVVA